MRRILGIGLGALAMIGGPSWSAPSDAGRGLPRCNSVTEMPGWGTLRIVSATLSGGRPAGTQFQQFSDTTRDMRGKWVVEYEIVNRSDRGVVWDLGDVFNKAFDDRGNQWVGMRTGSFGGDDRQYPPGSVKTGKLTFILYNGAVDARALTMQITAWPKSPARRISDMRSRRFELRIPRVAANCSERPTAAATPERDSAPRGLPAGLFVPRQTPGRGVSAPSADPRTVKYAVQVGFIWAYGLGVPPDYDQARRWYGEAERRQAASGDGSSRAEIARGLTDLNNDRIIDLLQKGQAKAAMSRWEEARFFFGLAASRGDVQGMAALGYVEGDGYRDAASQIYWCRKAFLGARRTGFREFEIDAVNYFCPLRAFEALMTPEERLRNPRSIARANAKSAAIRHDAEVLSQLLRNTFVAEPGGSANDRARRNQEFEMGQRQRNGDIRQAAGLPRTGPDSN